MWETAWESRSLPGVSRRARVEKSARAFSLPPDTTHRLSWAALQQISELLPIEGIDYVGLPPSEVQRVTVFSAGLVVGAQHQEAGRALIRFLVSPEVAPVIIKSGLEPATSP